DGIAAPLHGTTVPSSLQCGAVAPLIWHRSAIMMVGRTAMAPWRQASTWNRITNFKIG
ncbi:hypothetical protein TorRG33x02_336600, partial [Trema orientale]